MSGYRVTRYVVVSRWEPVEFDDESEARRLAARRRPSKLYQVTGEPVTDLWGRPVLVAEYPQLEAVQRLLDQKLVA